MFDMNKTLLLASVVCLFSLQANADDTLLTHDWNTTKFYIGADYNSTKVDLENGWNDIVDDTYNSGTLNLGLTFDKYFGIEGFYQNSTEKEGAYSSLKTNFNVYGADLLFYIHINDKIDFIATTGIGRYEVEAKIKYYNLTISETESDTGIRTGIGLQYNINDHWSFRAIGRYIHLNMESVDNMKELSLGIRYYF